MGRVFSGLIAGLVFGAGLSISGLMNPEKVVAFLDLVGDWDPSLAFVMLGGVAVSAAGFKLVLRRDRPIFESNFAVPNRTDLDARLLTGAGIFGIGWGLGGYCPGPALSGIGFGAAETLIFVSAMVLGMMAARHGGSIAAVLRGGGGRQANSA